LPEPFWKTAISKVEPNKIVVRGYNLIDLIDKYSYAGLAYLIWRGELPTKEQSRMMDALFSVCLEHSLNSPSVDAVRFVASCGVPLQSAVSAGVAAFGDWHGGAIEEAARLLQESVKAATLGKHPMQATAEDIVTKYSQSKEKLPGYGHPTHTEDPRTRKLLEVAEQTKLRGTHVQLAGIIESLTTKSFGRKLILNVDGCIAAIISDMGFDWRIGKGFFIVSRTPGLVAHAYEQLYYDTPYKVARWDEVVYTGPAERRVPDG
jgi:citrate synthase